MTIINPNTDTELCQCSVAALASQTPVATELDEIFECIPYKELEQTVLAARTRAFSPLGRSGYSLPVMLKAYLAGYVFGVRSTNDLIRRLQDDPVFGLVCGFDISQKPPCRKTFSRFIRKLAKHQALIDRCLNQIATKLHDLLPGFGDEVAIDPTPVHSHSKGNKKVISDPDAGWMVKAGGERKKWAWGLRLHLLVDANWELPIAKDVTSPKDGEKKVILPLLRKTKSELTWFNPTVVIGDKGYDKYEVFEKIVKEFDAEPVIKHANPLPEITGSPAAPICPAGLCLIYRSWDKNKGLQYQCPEKAGKASCPLAERCRLKTIWIHPVRDYRRFGYRIARNSEGWQELYHRRVAVERTISRLKDKRRLNSHCFRGVKMVNLHCSLAIIVMQAMALAKVKAGQFDTLRASVRKIA